MEENTDNIDNIDVIKWAFEKGYDLACSDFKEGVFINFSETEKLFLEELEGFFAETNNIV